MQSSGDNSHLHEVLDYVYGIRFALDQLYTFLFGVLIRDVDSIPKFS